MSRIYILGVSTSTEHPFEIWDCEFLFDVWGR